MMPHATMVNVLRVHTDTRLMRLSNEVKSAIIPANSIASLSESSTQAELDYYETFFEFMIIPF